MPRKDLERDSTTRDKRAERTDFFRSGRRVDRLIEKPSLREIDSELATIGRYCLKPDNRLHLRKAQPDKNDEIQLTDALRGFSDEGRLYAWVFRGHRYDIGDKADWMRATIRVALERPDFGKPVARMLRKLIDSR